MNGRCVNLLCCLNIHAIDFNNFNRLLVPPLLLTLALLALPLYHLSLPFLKMLLLKQWL